LGKTSTSAVTPYSLPQAYAWCRKLAKRHYENFPVASLLLPRHTRDAVAVIYAFARQADDFADEGELDAAQRLALLDDYASKLRDLDTDRARQDPVFLALADVIARYRLPLQLFHDLLSAFRQDVTKTRYRDFTEVMDYCRRSANPVGRLLLHLHGEASAQNLTLSDKVCSSLQLINFLQDLEQDYRENDRIYLPQDEMARFGVHESDIAARRNSPELQRLIAFQLERVSQLMHQGATLGGRLNGRFGLEIRLIIEGGFSVLHQLSHNGGDVFARPRLAKTDYLRLLWRALQKRRVPGAPARAPSS
jgi:squalene synthase HpnC